MALTKTIADFAGSFTGGGARPNQFNVSLNFPGSLGLNVGDAAKKSEFLCFAASLPASVIGTAPVNYRGRMVPLAGEREFAPWTISFYNDQTFDIRSVFEEWSNAINQRDTNAGVVNALDYVGDMIVSQLSRNQDASGEALKKYKFVSCWPTNVSEIQLDFGQNNVIETFSVTFNYAWWEYTT